MRLRVIKADGSAEGYLHTKVLATINNALCEAGTSDTFLAQELSEVVTYFLYERSNNCNVSSNEILSIIKAVLSSTGHGSAAAVLAEHHCRRNLRRGRTEVISAEVKELSDAQDLCTRGMDNPKNSWNKSIIAEHLIKKYGLARQTARTIAAMVEQKVLDLGVRLVPASLIRQLVLNDTAALLHAEKQLQTT